MQLCTWGCPLPILQGCTQERSAKFLIEQIYWGLGMSKTCQLFLNLRESGCHSTTFLEISTGIFCQAVTRTSERVPQEPELFRRTWHLLWIWSFQWDIIFFKISVHTRLVDKWFWLFQIDNEAVVRKLDSLDSPITESGEEIGLLKVGIENGFFIYPCDLYIW